MLTALALPSLFCILGMVKGLAFPGSFLETLLSMLKCSVSSAIVFLSLFKGLALPGFFC